MELTSSLTDSQVVNSIPASSERVQFLSLPVFVASVSFN